MVVYNKIHRQIGLAFAFDLGVVFFSIPTSLFVLEAVFSLTLEVALRSRMLAGLRRAFTAASDYFLGFIFTFMSEFSASTKSLR